MSAVFTPTDMSRQPKLCPKSHIPGYSDGLYDLGVIAPLPDTRQGFCEERREQRVFRVKRKHVLKACDRCRVKKTKVSDESSLFVYLV